MDLDALEKDHRLCQLVRRYEPELLEVSTSVLAARIRQALERIARVPACDTS